MNDSVPAKPNGHFIPHNPKGRIPGSRNLLGRKIVADFAEAWERDGADCLRIMAKEEPSRLAQLAIAILPKDVLVSVEQSLPGGLDPSDWALLTRVLDLIKQFAPTDASPGEVFGVIEQALRAHYAKLTGEADGSTVPTRR